MLKPPPERDCASFEELKRAVQKHAEKEGYAATVKRFKPTFSTGETDKCVLICERAGFSKHKPGAKPRKTHSKKCGCEFKINAIHKKPLKAWGVEIRNSEHNHENVGE